MPLLVVGTWAGCTSASQVKHLCIDRCRIIQSKVTSELRLAEEQFSDALKDDDVAVLGYASRWMWELFVT